jgi:hypothetical protein
MALIVDKWPENELPSTISRTMEMVCPNAASVTDLLLEEQK